MSLTYSFETPKDIYEKMKRDAAALEDEVTGDRAFNFVITAYHIKDWIEKSSDIAPAIKNDLKDLESNKYFRVCGDLANASKHMKLTRRNPSTADASSNQGWGLGRWGKGAWGIGEEDIEITHLDGSVIDILELKNQMMMLWTEFFLKHKI